MINIPDFYRPDAKYATYPPYHTGLYLEEYFYEYAKGKKFNREYIPIFWTNIYCNNAPCNIQAILDRLPGDQKYFCVMQHDNAPLERMPRDVKMFSSGAHFNTADYYIPLPSICSKIKDPDLSKARNIFCSFIGTNTHPIRIKLNDKLKHNKNYEILLNYTDPQNMNTYLKFKDITERSIFTLCPRGYGKSSFRLYEAMQLGSIPVYVSDAHYLPWTDELDWDNLAVLVKENEIDNIDEILKSISGYKIEKILKYTQSIYDQYFTLDGVCKNIEKRI